MTGIVEANRLRDLYFVIETGRVIYLPKGWCDEFEPSDDDGPSIYGYYGNTDTANWKTRDSKEFYTYDSQGYFSVSYLEQQREVTEAEARAADPELFELLDAINSGEAT